MKMLTFVLSFWKYFHFGHFFKFLSSQGELERIKTKKIFVDAEGHSTSDHQKKIDF